MGSIIINFVILVCGWGPIKALAIWTVLKVWTVFAPGYRLSEWYCHLLDYYWCGNICRTADAQKKKPTPIVCQQMAIWYLKKYVRNHKHSIGLFTWDGFDVFCATNRHISTWIGNFIIFFTATVHRSRMSHMQLMWMNPISGICRPIARACTYKWKIRNVLILCTGTWLENLQLTAYRLI